MIISFIKKRTFSIIVEIDFISLKDWEKVLAKNFLVTRTFRVSKL